MPNTKSAEKRMRGNARKALANNSVRNRLKTLQRHYADALKSGKRETAEAALRSATSGFDKAVKSGVVHRGTADRKKSRMAGHLARMAASPPAS